MRIVIVGAGAVGSYLAARLSSEGQDVVVIESDERHAAELQDRVDALVIVGNGASPSSLEEAGIRKADLLIAVSNSDGANALACHTARTMGVKRTVARIEDQELRSGLVGLGVDVVIDPGEMAAREIVGLLGHSGVSDLVEFARGELVLVGSIARKNSPMVKVPLSELRSATNWEWVVVAVVRHGETIVARGDTVIEELDHVLLMTTRANLDRATEFMGVHQEPIRRAIIVGATRLAELTADRLLERGVDVVMVDEDGDRCRSLAERHDRVLVLCADATNPAVLEELGVSDKDAIVGLTGWDQINALSCMVGKALGASTTVARFNRIAYVGLLGGSGIDAAVSARLAAANAILRFVRRGRIHSVATFKDTDAEAIEIEVAPESRAVGKLLRELDLTSGAIIGGIHREGDVVVPHGATEIHARDRLILFALPTAIHDVEQLFTG
ncbi:MAG: Trk system potassium transporter TrkA [Acidimicrobiia bacterium]|nr:Trk system potassium transporter TrkA [Acidimicrobiia bacterium]